MSALVFLKLRQWRNAIIRAIKTPAKLALIVLYAFAFIIMLFFMVFGSNFSSRMDVVSGNGPHVVVGIIAILAYFFSYAAAKSGKDGVNRIFSEADAHILFASPMRPQSLLIYGLSNQLLAGIFSSVFLLFQVGNFYNFGITGAQVWVIFVAWIMVAIKYALVRMLSYVIIDRWPQGQKLVTVYAFLAIGILLLSGVLAYSGGGSFSQMLSRFMGMPQLRYFPLAGWVLVLIEGLMLGMQLEHWLMLLLLIATIPLTFYFVYRKPVDFYEDAQLFAKPQNLAGSNSNVSLQELMKPKKDQKVSYVGIGAGLGASTLFYKQVLEKRRQRKFYLGFAFLMYLAYAILLSYLSLKLHAFPPRWLGIIYAGSFVMMRFTMSSINPLAFELNNPYFFLYPMKAFERSLYGQLAGVMFMAVDVLPGFLLCVILGGIPLIPALLLFIMMLSASMVTTAAYLLTYGIAGRPDKGLYALLLMAITAAFLTPSVFGVIIVAVAAGLSTSWTIAAVVLFVMILVNMGIAMLAVPGMKMIMEKGQDT